MSKLLGKMIANRHPKAVILSHVARNVRRCTESGSLIAACSSRASVFCSTGVMVLSEVDSEEWLAS